MAVSRELASARHAGDDSAATGLAAQAGIPRWLLTHPELGPRGRLDTGDAGDALGCISVLAAGGAVTLVPWLAKPAVLDLVAEAVETAAAPCPCGSGRKYKACCRVTDLDGGVHPLPHRAPALYAMLATYARRGPNRKVVDRMAACVGPVIATLITAAA